MQARLRFKDGPSPCMYLPDRAATLEYEIVARISPEEYEARMEQGWRKFGRFLFQPVCKGCRECRSMRVPLDCFTPDRSQRRALKQNADLTVHINRPTIDRERMSLYDRYHRAQNDRKGWPYEKSSPWQYSFVYVKNPTPSLELAAYEGDRLVGICLLDVTPNALSGIYHYHDPDLSRRSLGKFLMLRSIQAAREMGKTHFYLGYYVAGCGSMEYKATFLPCEILTPDGIWRQFTD